MNTAKLPSQDQGSRLIIGELIEELQTCRIAEALDTEIGPTRVTILATEQARNPQVRELFLTEAARLLTIKHPNLIEVHDLHSLGASVAVVYARAQGTSLADRLVHGPLSVSQGLRIAIQVVRAVATLHQRGIIHRDLRPGHVITDQRGITKLANYGLERFLEEIHEDDTGAYYRAPEEAEGESISAATDIYQLGLLLHEIFTGKYPSFNKRGLKGNDLKRAPLPPSLALIIKRCLALDPAERLSSAQQLLKSLQEVLVQFRSGPIAKV